MKVGGVFSSVSCVALIAGCTTHPLPENVTRYNTVQIVQKIRCETRDAARDIAIDYLTDKDQTEEAQEFGRILRADPDNSFRDAKKYYHHLDSDTRKDVERYDGIAVAYEFTFDMTEKNDNNANLMLFNPYSFGQRFFGISAGLNRRRQNIRNFRIVETMDHLTRTLRDDECEFDGNSLRDSLYPISGTVGIKEVLKTFIDLNEMADIKKKNAEKQNIPTFADTLEFETTLVGKLEPKIVLNQVTEGIGLNEATFTSEHTRTDKHKLGIVITLPIEGDRKTKSGFVSKTKREEMTKERALRELDRQDDKGFRESLNRLSDVSRRF